MTVEMTWGRIVKDYHDKKEALQLIETCRKRYQEKNFD